jgi:signal transduction histidine kinase
MAAVTFSAEEAHAMLCSGAALGDVLARTAERLGSALGATGVAIWREGSTEPEVVWGRVCPDGRRGRAPSVTVVETSEGPLSGLPVDRTVGCLVIPIGTGARTVALMQVWWDPPRPLPLAERDHLQSLMGVLALAVEHADLLDQLRQQEQSLHGLLQKTLTAQEEERRRLARELHDETSQILSALIMNIDVLETEVSVPAPSRSRLEAAKALAEEAARNLGKVLLDLRPALLDEFGLVAALRWYISQFQDMWDLPVDFAADGAKRLPEHVETAAFRIVQEALANVARHARASEAHVREWVEGEAVHLEIVDDGAGFDVEEAMVRARNGDAAGLTGMRERAELLGGSLQVRSRPGKGTAVSVEIPLAGSPGSG